MSQQLKSAINGLAITIEEMNHRMKNAQIVINDPAAAAQMFLAMAKEAGEQSAKTVMNEVLAGQQQQINELAQSMLALTGLVQGLLESQLTVTHEETVTRKVTQTVTTKQPEQPFEDGDGALWVHVPTTPSGKIRWKGNSEMDTEHVIYQVLYELERVQGKKIDSFKDIPDKSIYNSIKNRMVGIPWGMIVEEARRNAIKL